MSDLGCVNNSLELQCKLCVYRPGRQTKIEAVQLHCQVEHDTDDVALDLVPVCTCGSSMRVTETRPTGGGFKDYARCPACGNTGYIKRET